MRALGQSMILPPPYDQNTPTSVNTSTRKKYAKKHDCHKRPITIQHDCHYAIHMQFGAQAIFLILSGFLWELLILLSPNWYVIFMNIQW